MQREFRSYVQRAALVFLCAAVMFVGCGRLKPKPQPGEPADVYKRRLVAINFAQAATTVDGVSDAVAALVTNDVMERKAGADTLALVSKVIDTWQQAKNQAQSGVLDKSTADKIGVAIAFVEELQNVGVLGIKNPKNQEQFRSIVAGGRLALTAAKNLILVLDAPGFDTRLETIQARAGKDLEAARSKATVGFDLAAIAMDCFGRAARQASLPSAELAYADGQSIADALRTKNDARIADYRR